MITKTIHLIWIGDRLPIYADTVIKHLKKLNAGYNINILFETTNNIHNSTIPEIQETLYILRLHVCCIKTKYSDYINTRMKWNLNFITLFSDLLRLVVLDRHGGIYIDFDVIPMIPFDDIITNKRSIGVKCISYLQHNDYLQFKEQEQLKNYPSDIRIKSLLKQEYFDLFFIAAEANCIGNTILIDNAKLELEDNIDYIFIRNKDENSYEFQQLSLTFKNGELDVDELDKSRILYHFCNRTWQLTSIKTAINRTCYDDMLYGDMINCRIHLDNDNNINTVIENINTIRLQKHKMNINIICRLLDVEKLKRYDICKCVSFNSEYAYRIYSRFVFDIPGDYIITDSDIASIYDFTFNKIAKHFICNSITGHIGIWNNEQQKYCIPKQTFYNTILYCNDIYNNYDRYANVISLSEVTLCSAKD